MFSFPIVLFYLVTTSWILTSSAYVRIQSIKSTNKKNGTTEFGNYRDISLVSHAGKKVLHEVVAWRIGDQCEAKGDCYRRSNASFGRVARRWT